eukprot:snap_masked-scaffold_15-processed-gene-0.15-mRNA-1 protein AED:1.00 eAED:1.00 QI:0/0/0/0/1/1/2/0/67
MLKVFLNKRYKVHFLKSRLRKDICFSFSLKVENKSGETVYNHSEDKDCYGDNPYEKFRKVESLSEEW